MLSLTPAAFFRNKASCGSNLPSFSGHPVSTGFITPTSMPFSFSAAAMPPVTNVLPTPVSVPVIKNPFVDIFGIVAE